MPRGGFPSADAIEQTLAARKVAADSFIHKFVYYIVGLEIVVCGYILSNIEKFILLGYWLLIVFLVGGSSALLGLVYKYFDNNISHAYAYDPSIRFADRQMKLFGLVTSGFFVLSLLFFILMLVAGCFYIYCCLTRCPFN